MSANTLAIYGLAAAAACALTYGAITFHKMSSNHNKLEAFINSVSQDTVFTLSGNGIDKSGTCTFYQQHGRHNVKFKENRYELDLYNLSISNENEIIGEDRHGKMYTLAALTSGGKRRRRSRAWR